MSLYNNIVSRNKIKGIFQDFGGKVSTVLNKEVVNSFGDNIYTQAASKLGDLAVEKGADMAANWVNKQITYYLNINNWFHKKPHKGITEKKQFMQIAALKRARKNHFIVRVKTKSGDPISNYLDLFITDVELTPMNITGEKHKVGGAFVDAPSGSEATELRFTTMDDKAGRIKKWFESLCSAVVAHDGTFGVPADYGVTITVLHAFVAKQTQEVIPFENKGLFRAANYEVQLSRRDQAMQEVNLTFTQIDSFMRF